MGEINEYKNILAVTNRLNQDVPVIAKLYMAAEQMAKQAADKQEQLVNAADQSVKRAEEVIKKAEAGMKKLDKVLKKMQEIEERMDAKTAWLETLQKEEKRIEENRKKEKEAEALRKADKEENRNRKMDCMVQMIEALAMQQENRDIQLFTKEDYTANKTILELYNRFRYQLTGPVIVQNEIWKGDFCFAIDHISENGKIAVGLWFKNGEPKTEKNGYDCGEPVSSYKSFRIYSGPSYKKIAATFPYWKMLYLDEKQKESDSSLIQDASNVPPDWDEVELPFH
ncbi:MAG: hypothetical protein J6J42_10440 [Lachnospiraceae bacterium]|nr:hypothetical protein [Lachnospiraceae bacterium]